MEKCPICSAHAQSQGMTVISRHKYTGTPSTTVRAYRCSDPLCLDLKGKPHYWRTTTEFLGWSSAIDYDPIALIGEQRELALRILESSDQPGAEGAADALRSGKL